MRPAALREPPTRVGAVTHTSRRTRTRRRRVALLVTGLLLLATAACALSLGDASLTPGELVRTLLGGGDPSAQFVVFRLRLPRLAIGLLVGTGFGVAGAIFQGVLRNPLASPDLLGISGGASVAAVYALLLLGWSGPAVSLAALLGALAVAGAITALAWRGGIVGQQFIVIGVAVAMLISGALGYLLTRADVRDVSSALVWMVGSTASVGWDEIALVAIASAALLAGAALVGRTLHLLALGDGTASGLGARVDRDRIVLIAVAVALVACGTAVVGPIAFVAFVARPIAGRVLGTGEPPLALAGAVGAVIVTAGDVIGQHLLPAGIQVPVGIVTALIGAPYLLWLLATSRTRKDTG